MCKDNEKQIREVVKHIVEDSSKDVVELNEKTFDRVLSPNIGEIVLRFNGAKFIKVKIKDGRFWGDYNRVSNFWYWYEEDENGDFTKEQYGYGCFYKEEHQ